MHSTGAQDLPLERLLKYILTGRWQDAGEERQPLYWDEPWEYALISSEMRRACDLPQFFPDPRFFARRLGMQTLCRHVPGSCYGEITDGEFLIYSSRGGPRMQGLRVYHGVAHRLAERWLHGAYTHGDVWLLTAELAMPAWYLKEVGVDHASTENQHVPEWLIALLDMAIRRAA